MPKTVVNVTYSTLEQAETEVFRLIESKTNYRDICQIEFIVNGIKKKFSLSQISKIKQKLSPKDNFNSLETKSDSEQKAELFELFKNKESVVDVIIKTKLDSKLVNDSFQEYVKLSGDIVVSEKSLDDVLEILYECDGEFDYVNYNFETPFGILRACKDYLEKFRESLHQFQYPCNVCRKLITMNKLEWKKTAKPAIIEARWKHGECQSTRKF
jgi:hypothetical protein